MGLWEVWRVDDSISAAISLLTTDEATAKSFAAGRQALQHRYRYVALPAGGSPFDDTADDDGDDSLAADVLRARKLAALMNHWLIEGHSLDDIPSDVIEWCRSARDLLTRMDVRS